MALPYEEDGPPTDDGSGSGSPGGSGAGADPYAGLDFGITFGSGGFGSGLASSPSLNLGLPSLFNSGSGFMAGISAQIKDTIAKLTGNIPKVEKEPEPKKEVEPVAPTIPKTDLKTPTWVWYVGSAVFGLILIGGVVWYQRRKK